MDVLNMDPIELHKVSDWDELIKKLKRISLKDIKMYQLGVLGDYDLVEILFPKLKPIFKEMGVKVEETPGDGVFPAKSLKLKYQNRYYDFDIYEKTISLKPSIKSKDKKYEVHLTDHDTNTFLTVINGIKKYFESQQQLNQNQQKMARSIVYRYIRGGDVNLRLIPLLNMWEKQKIFNNFPVTDQEDKYIKRKLQEYSSQLKEKDIKTIARCPYCNILGTLGGVMSYFFKIEPLLQITPASLEKIESEFFHDMGLNADKYEYQIYGGAEGFLGDTKLYLTKEQKHKLGNWGIICDTCLKKKVGEHGLWHLDLPMNQGNYIAVIKPNNGG